jgi:hypothetical protein
MNLFQARTLFFALFFINLNFPLLASEFYWMKTSTNEWRKSNKVDFFDGRLKSEVLDSLDLIYSKSPDNYYFYFNGKELLSFVNCGFDLFSITDSSLKQKYSLFNRGYTCRTKPFVRDSTNFLLGGYSFWSSHIDLLVLDEINGSWELFQTINQPIDYGSSGVFQNSEGIYSIFGEYLNERKGLKEIEPNGYFLDWETKEWKRLDVQIDGVDLNEVLRLGSPSFLETKDFVFMVSNSELMNVGWNIIEKETGKIYFYDLRNSHIFLSPFTEVIDNTIHYQSPDGTQKSLDLEYLLSQSKEVGFIKVLEKGLLDTFSLKSNSFISISIFTLLGIVILSFIWVKNGKKQPVKTLTFDEMEKLIESFKPYSGQLLDLEKMDSLLEIDSKGNPDLNRVKRSRMIIRVNKYYTSQKGKELIVREKDSKDKRFVYYKVNI